MPAVSRESQIAAAELVAGLLPVHSSVGDIASVRLNPRRDPLP